MSKPLGWEFGAQLPHISLFGGRAAGLSQRKRDMDYSGQTEKTKEVSFNIWRKHSLTITRDGDYIDA